MGNRRKCGTCGQDAFYAIERGEFFPIRMHVCVNHIKRGDKVFHGRYGSRQFTIWNYQ